MERWFLIMSNIIFYFTGTGNSLAVARDIADKIGDTKVISIAEAMRENSVDLPYERIGFVFPVYYSSVPAIVKRFIEKLSFDKSQYIFGVVTYGGTHGLAFSQLSQLIAERGGFLNASFGMPMPGNYIVKYGAFPHVMQQRLLKKGKKRASSISITVKEKESTRLLKGDLLSRLIIGYVNKMVAGVGGMAGNFHTTEKCNGCGTCERVCPVGNISMMDMHPSWGSACEQCVACIQWCPMQAIEYADRTTNRKHYQNPEVKISDLLSNSNI
jgi:ferredoxin/flavodoxin